MEPRVTEGLAIDTEWLYEVARRCQIMLCDQVNDFRGDPPLAGHALAGLSAPANRLEQLLLRGVLFETLAGATAECPAEGDWDVAFAQKVLDAAWSRRQRNLSVARRAAAVVEAGYADELRVRELARRIGSNVSTLRLSFRREFSISLKQYQTRARIGAALQLFGAGNTKVSSVARLVGYRSERNFYRAFRQLTGLTPASLKSMPRADLIELSLRVTDPLRSLSDRRSSAVAKARTRPHVAADRRRRLP